MGFTVKQAHRYAELTQEDVAKSLGVSVSTYARLEKHPDLFTMAQAQRFCNAVSISEDEKIFTGQSTKSRTQKGGTVLTGCIYTPEEITERWRCSSVTVCRLLNAGKLEGFRVGCG